MIELKDKSFDDLIADGTTLVMMTTSWCPHCKQGIKRLEEMESLYHIKTAKIDVQANTKTLMRYAPNGMPYFILFENGEQVLRHKGTSMDVFKEYLNDRD